MGKKDKSLNIGGSSMYIYKTDYLKSVISF
ncbi:hypothetical protein B0H39_002204 [Clostridium beijerinckii]|jgi:hypothetical protein|nr:hypothetical protein [Clostridium beijerinckii]